MVINHNMMAANTNRKLGINSANTQKSLEKLSSGLRINKAGDDAAGLAISEKMRSQVRGLDQASRNSQDGISLIQTAEGALNETHDILQRMRELGVQAASDTNVSVDRDEIQKEINQLTSEINRIGNTTEFNTMKLVDGSRSSSSRAGTSAVRTIAIGGDFTANFSDGITAKGGMTDTTVIKGGLVTLDSSDPEMAQVASVASTITVLKGTAGWTVKMQLKDSAAVTITSTETYAFSADADFAYENHGVSFTIEKAEFAKFTAKDTGLAIEFDKTDVTAGNVAGASDWSVNSSTGATITGGVTISANLDPSIEGARKIVIENKDGSNEFIVDIQDSAGTSISKDTFTHTGGGTIAYDHQGISFEAKINGNTSAKMTIDLKTKQTKASSVVVDNSLSFQVGANESQSMSLSLSDMRAEALGISSTTAGVDGEVGFREDKDITDGTSNISNEYGLDVSSHEAAAASVTTINNAIEKVSSERSKLGAVQNRLEHTIKNLSTSSENLQSAESRVRDVDMATEMMEFTKNNILQQAAQAMLSQANQQTQGVLSLLR